VQDTVRNMRFSINFFTSIGLGGLTDSMREHLANMPKIIAAQQAAALAAARAEVRTLVALGSPNGEGQVYLNPGCKQTTQLLAASAACVVSNCCSAVLGLRGSAPLLLHFPASPLPAASELRVMAHPAGNHERHTCAVALRRLGPMRAAAATTATPTPQTATAAVRTPIPTTARPAGAGQTAGMPRVNILSNGN